MIDETERVEWRAACGVLRRQVATAWLERDEARKVAYTLADAHKHGRRPPGRIVAIALGYRTAAKRGAP